MLAEETRLIHKPVEYAISIGNPNIYYVYMTSSPKIKPREVERLNGYCVTFSYS
jgi:hypothetical protein